MENGNALEPLKIFFEYPGSYKQEVIGKDNNYEKQTDFANFK